MMIFGSTSCVHSSLLKCHESVILLMFILVLIPLSRCMHSGYSSVDQHDAHIPKLAGCMFPMRQFVTLQSKVHHPR